MSLLTSNKFISCDLLCSKLMQNSDVSYSGFVNKRGRTVTCGKNTSLKFHDEKSLEMFVMEIALDFSMKNEFNDILGKVEYTVTKREDFAVLCIPMDELILVIITNACHNVEKVVKNAYEILYEFAKKEQDLHELV